MGEAQIRTTYDLVATYNVTAPASSGAYASLASLLTGAQVTEMAPFLAVGVQMFCAATAFNFKHATPGAGAQAVSPNSNPQVVNANQKPNEAVYVMDTLNRIFVQSSTTSAITVAITVFAISRDTL